MGHRLKIAAIQMDCTPASVSERLARATDLIAEVAVDGAQLIVLPELFNTGYEFHERNYALAESIDGETVSWMKVQAKRHAIHLVGSMLLRDRTDVYNSALLVAPDGYIWRYDKHYVPFWERAYFRGGEHITVAETSLGKLGMLICWDQYHPDLWEAYASRVDAMVIMSCPGDIASGDLIFPDGDRAKFMDLAPSNLNATVAKDAPINEETDYRDRQVAWMRVPVVEASATGIVRTNLPLIEAYFAQSPLADRVAQASETFLECGFPPTTRIVSANGEDLARGTAIGDGVVIAEVEIPDTTPQPDISQPAMNIAPEMYQLSDEIVPAMMIPLYKTGLRNQWGDHMAPD